MQTQDKSRAIVVDDSAAIRSFVGLVLQRRGFEVIEAKDGSIALDLLQQSGPLELAIVDWNMPEMAGIALVDAIRTDARFDHMQIMMVTSETEINRVRKALVSGANEYLMKPFDEQMITDKLKMMGL